MTEFEKLSEIIHDANGLLGMDVTCSSPEFKAWKMKSERFLIKKYGEGSHEAKDFLSTKFGLMFLTGSTPHSDWVNACHNGIRSSIAVFETYLEELSDASDTPQSVRQEQNYKMDKVFLVHGHNGELKESVARIIEKQGIEAIILSEKANQGRTIIEKFEDYSNVGGAICLFTADDIGNAKTVGEHNPRARQNVVFETGYFMGRLGRNHIVILADQGVEMPSDLSGVVYMNTENWQANLLKELKVMGYTVDFKKLF